MQTAKIILLSAAFAICPIAASAGNGAGNITKLTAYGNVVLFSTDSDTGNPACDTDSSGHWVLDASTTQGKVEYAALLTAVSADKSVAVWGTNTCPSWWATAESPNSITLTP